MSSPFPFAAHQIWFGHRLVAVGLPRNLYHEFGRPVGRPLGLLVDLHSSVVLLKQTLHEMGALVGLSSPLTDVRYSVAGLASYGSLAAALMAAAGVAAAVGVGVVGVGVADSPADIVVVELGRNTAVGAAAVLGYPRCGAGIPRGVGDECNVAGRNQYRCA